MVSGAKSRHFSSSVHVYKEEAVSVFHEAKSGSNVNLLSSIDALQNCRTRTIDAETNKPNIVLYYNRTKGDVGNFDKLIRDVFYETQIKTMAHVHSCEYHRHLSNKCLCD